MELIIELDVMEKKEIEIQLARFSKLRSDALTIELLELLALEQIEP
jgi:hypothetical protein